MVTSPLLRLPLEVRRIIYAFALPFATNAPERQAANVLAERLMAELDWAAWANHPTVCNVKGRDAVWTRGCTALLAVSKQVHEETAAMLYGDNKFIVNIKFDGISFYLRWRTSQDLTLNRTYSFFGHLSQRNLLRIRHYVVNVELVDEYTGMIKYNCGGQGLPAGMRAQVRQLVELMAGVENLQAVNINLFHSPSGADTAFGRTSSEPQKGKEEAQAREVLAPFACLREVRRIEMTGVSEQHMKDLRRMMTAPKSKPAISECN
ncbi:hypothetical protein DE146DRAFT_620764 [Phaeosphaeria sp. MPI-PUGE-AT-0046c]|nr:hypothetical protein DE146DRAFT_620764 [Phaeosphaeria sp. MPI-PUGE-AT-0046c]